MCQILIQSVIASAASAIQAASGNVAAKGAVAQLQSAAMGGYGVVAVNAITTLGAGVVGTIVGGWAFGQPEKTEPVKTQ